MRNRFARPEMLSYVMAIAVRNTIVRYENTPPQRWLGGCCWRLQPQRQSWRRTSPPPHGPNSKHKQAPFQPGRLAYHTQFFYDLILQPGPYDGGDFDVSSHLLSY